MHIRQKIETVGVGTVKCIKQFMIMANSWLDLGLKHLISMLLLVTDLLKVTLETAAGRRGI